MDFYSYLWIREKDGTFPADTPYYAGKGIGKRINVTHRGSLHPPKNPIYRVKFPMISEAEAFESEIAMIEMFGRIDLGTGCLRNMTNGGDGVRELSEDIRKKNAVRHRGNTYRRGKKFSKAQLRRLSEAHKGQEWSEESRLKLSKTTKGKSNAGSFQQGCVPVNKGVPHSGETRRKLREAWVLRKIYDRNRKVA